MDFTNSNKENFIYRISALVESAQINVAHPAADDSFIYAHALFDQACRAINGYDDFWRDIIFLLTPLKNYQKRDYLFSLVSNAPNQLKVSFIQNLPDFASAAPLKNMAWDDIFKSLAKTYPRAMRHHDFDWNDIAGQLPRHLQRQLDQALLPPASVKILCRRHHIVVCNNKRLTFSELREPRLEAGYHCN